MTRKALIFCPILIVLLAAIVLGIFQLSHGSPLTHFSAADQDKSLQDFYKQSQNAATGRLKQEEPRTVTFLAFGDISLSRNIAATIQAKKDPLYPFHNIVDLLKSTDFNFANLETPFSKSDAFTAKNTLVFNAPKGNIVGLKEYNFKVLNLANNHAFDQGIDGVDTTAKVLDDNGLLHMGAGKTLDAAWTPAIIEKNGIKIGFIGASYSSVNDGGKTLNNYVARIEDTDRLTSNVKRLKSNVDFVVVTMHAGTEYTPKANQQQIDFAHAAIDAGADIVIGAHPHWVQERELYCPPSYSSPFQGEAGRGENQAQSSTRTMPSTRGDLLTGQLISFTPSIALTGASTNCRPIYYSLGNFIFDQSWSEQTKKGLALKVTLSKSGSGSPPFQGGVRGGENNTAVLSNLQPSASPAPIPILESIEEIPISIKENCCPVINTPN